ncbi:MAG: DHHA1 domain-containing protein, partial [Yaniella sp.]
QLVDKAETVGQVTLLTHNLGDISSADDLRSTVLDLRDRLTKAGNQNIVVGMVGTSNNRPLVVISVNEGAQALGLKAGNLVKAASQMLGGGGGGKPDLAQGGGQDVTKLDEALASIRQEVETA